MSESEVLRHAVAEAVKALAPAGHAKIMQPSKCPTWYKCPAGAVMTYDLPPEQSPYAEEGQDAHELAAYILNGCEESKAGILDELAEKGRDRQQMESDIQPYLDYVRQHCDRQAGDQLYIEEPLDLEPVTGEHGARGTSDAVIVRADGTLIIADLKYGKGVQVFAEKNLQLLCYAIAAYESFSTFSDIRRVTLAIIQPRLDHISEWSITLEDLMDHAKDIRAAADRVWDAMKLDRKDVPYNPTPEGCRWCRMRHNCAALSRSCLNVIGGAELLNAGLGPYLEPEALSRILDAVPQVEAWLKAVQEYAQDELLKGHDIPGYKLVKGRAGARTWDSDQADAIMLKGKVKADYRYTKKVVSPAQAEKLQKQGKIAPDVWAELEKLIVREDGKPVMVPESDPRKKYDELEFPDESALTEVKE